MDTEVPSADGVVIGIDIGGTKTQATAFDAHSNQIAELRVPTVGDGNDAVAMMTVHTIAALKGELGDRSVEAIGIGIPGLVTLAEGSVRQAVNLGIGDEPLNLGSRVAAAHGVPCYVDNDVNVAALGAYQILGEGGDTSDLAYLSIGTGIAAGVIIHGRLHHGRRGVAGEIGHFPVIPDGIRCECGLQGCLETVASGAAIRRQWPDAAGVSPAASLVRAASAGHEQAIVTLQTIAGHLASAIYLLAITYDVERIIVGGGVAEVGQDLMVAIHDGLRELENRSGFVQSLDLTSRVFLTPAGPVGTVGAAALTKPCHHP
ncbi:MAG: ROK family protein [Acidimicrobiales bacterium]